MAYISKIRVPGVETAYLIKDNEGRLMIAPAYSSSTSYATGDYYVKEGYLWKVTTGGIGDAVTGVKTSVADELKSIKQSIAGAMHYIGVTSTKLTDGATKEDFPTLEPATPGSLTKTSGFVAGDVVLAPASDKTAEKYYEYVFNGTVWSEFGSTKPIGQMAYANTATGSTTITYKDTKYTGGTVEVNEYSETGYKYIIPTTVVGSVKVGTTTSASSVTKKNKYLATTKIWTGDSTAAVTDVTATKKSLATTEIFGIGETGAALTEVTANTMRLKTTSIYGVKATELEASKVERGATNIRVGDTALTTVANGLLGEARDAKGYNPLVGAQVENECLSWFESPLDTTQIRGVAYQTIDVPDVKITDVTGIAQKENSAITVATGSLIDKTEAGGDMVAISVTGTTDSFAKKGATGTIVATGQLSDNGSDIVTGIDYNSVRNFVRSDRYMVVATGDIADSDLFGDNIADAIEITQVNGLVTGLSVENKNNVLRESWSGETGSTGLLTGITSTKVTKDVTLTKDSNEKESVNVEITVGPTPEPKYLTMTILELPEGSPTTQISINKIGEPVGTNFQYKVNNREWTDWDFTNPQAISANAGDVIQWKGNNPSGLSKDSSNYIYFQISNEVDLSGNVMSLIDGIGDTKVIPCNYCFESLFENTKIKTVSEDFLPATTLTEFCYGSMFSGCTSLVSVPELPATTLSEFCYVKMFYGCTSLTTAPALPATTLASNCYQDMFWECSYLVNAPSSLPATTLAGGCYRMMFAGCSSLVNAPALPATTLAGGCYEEMFSRCTSLVSAPELPATTLADYCYNYMFRGCTSLTTSPALPATTLAERCYANMFNGCTSLVTAPALPATTFYDSCYRQMFSGCKSLTTAPELPATTLAGSCYRRMFDGCSNLQNVTCFATDISAQNCTSNWLRNVAYEGTFVKASGFDGWESGASGIPEDWTVIEYEQPTGPTSTEAIDAHIDEQP